MDLFICGIHIENKVLVPRINASTEKSPGATATSSQKSPLREVANMTVIVLFQQTAFF